MTTSANNRKIAVLKAAKEAGLRVIEYVQPSQEVEEWILNNSISKTFDNGDRVEAVIVNGKFIAADYFVKSEKENVSITEENWNELRIEFNF